MNTKAAGAVIVGVGLSFVASNAAVLGAKALGASDTVAAIAALVASLVASYVAIVVVM